MPTKRPAIHGYDHTPNGPDPIPGQGTQFATAWVNNVTIASGASVDTVIDFPTLQFATNAPDLFDIGLDSFSRGVNTVRILQPGTYKVFVCAQYPGIAAGRVPKVYYDPPLNHGALQFGTTQILTATGPDNQASFWENVYGDTTTDVFTFPRGGAAFVTNDAAGTFQAYVQMWIELIDHQRIPLI